ncbi:MAG: dNTP triphosphohydrolase [Muribaculaceae bacterium]|nr:dNTP triphosphohydrolase [Muribaculaceae bacterium]
MNWETLICDKRFGAESAHDPRNGSRSDFQRDYDRLVFSSPFRRLQNKTQVFPLPGSIFVHNRLTHSLEVACVGRSMASEVANRLRMKYGLLPWTHRLDSIGEIVAAACLAHDLGNPPFGHSGEKAIGTFFSEGPGKEMRGLFEPQQWADLSNFEGNANSFRLLTHVFEGRRPGGFAMTYATLASVVKYPYESTLAGVKGKFGFFSSEKDTFVRVATELGLRRLSAPGKPLRYARHPLVYIVEAADDICYEVMDLEDAHKLGLLTTAEVSDLLLAFFPPDIRDAKARRMNDVSDPNEKIGYLRGSVINRLVGACADLFVQNEETILNGTFKESLIYHLPALERDAYRAAEAVSYSKIYNSSDVVDIELAGHAIISFLLEALVKAVLNPELNYSQLLLSKVPKQYNVAAPTLFGKVQAVLDHISGMTDVYALDLYRRLNGMSLKINN